ncbi:MAG TPA: translation elongation factor Ts [Oscillospiraceae bacterium]|nr:translation elongation factor Ts [Oscillospiraceae bacterium]
MEFTAKDVADLRTRTGVGMMDCKKALAEANGDTEKAIEILREKGLAAAAKKAGRIAAEGMAYSEVCAKCKKGVIVEVNCETDFAAKSEPFKELVSKIANAILTQKPTSVEDLMTKDCGGESLEAFLKSKIYTIGENISIRRFKVMDGHLMSYVHGGGRIAVLVKFETTDAIAATAKFTEAAKDVAMQIAAMNPLFLDAASVDEETLAKEREIAKTAAINEGKPANIADKIVEGRIKKYYKEVCLVEQAFVKDAEISVTQYLNAVSKELGGDIKAVAFERFERGEGLAKKEDNFADEVAGMIK